VGSITPRWPQDVPFLQLEGQQYRRTTKILRTAMDRGPAKVRAFSKVEPRIYTGILQLSGQQLDDFFYWFDNDLDGGVLTFIFDDFHEADERLARLVVPENGYNPERQGETTWQMEITIEVLPS